LYLCHRVFFLYSDGLDNTEVGKGGLTPSERESMMNEFNRSEDEDEDWDGTEEEDEEE